MNIKKCPKCGIKSTKRRGEDRYCTKCGTQLTNYLLEAIIITIFILLIIFSVLMFIAETSDNKSKGITQNISTQKATNINQRIKDLTSRTSTNIFSEANEREERCKKLKGSKDIKTLESSYALWNFSKALEHPEIKVMSTNMKVYGLVKNTNKECKAYSTLMYVELIKNGEVVQSESFFLGSKEEDYSVYDKKGYNYVIYPDNGYRPIPVVDFTYVFEVRKSLLKAVYKTRSVVERYELASGVKVKTYITVFEWK